MRGPTFFLFGVPLSIDQVERGGGREFALYLFIYKLGCKGEIFV